MTIVSDLVQQSYREVNIIAVGATPSAAQAAEGLTKFNRLIKGYFGTIMGEMLADWEFPAPQRTAPVAANYPQLPYPQGLDGNLLSLPFNTDPGIAVTPYPPKNSRVVFAGKTPMTVYFPEQPDDGSRMAVIQGATGPASVVLTIDGNGRTIDGDPTFTVTTPITHMEWLYRADIGDWRPVAALVGTDESPFSHTMDDFLVAATALRLAPGFGKTASVETVAAYKAGLSAFRARYRQAGTTTFGSGQIPNSQQSYVSGRWWY